MTDAVNESVTDGTPGSQRGPAALDRFQHGFLAADVMMGQEQMPDLEYVEPKISMVL